jgi:hypothetical protein
MRQDLMDRMHRILFDETVMNSAQPIKKRVYYPRVNIALRWVSCGLFVTVIAFKLRNSLPLLLFPIFAFPVIDWCFPLAPLAYKLPKFCINFVVAGTVTFCPAVVLNIALGSSHQINLIMRPWILAVVSCSVFVFLCGRIFEDIKLWKKASTVDSKTGTTDSV